MPSWPLLFSFFNLSFSLDSSISFLLFNTYDFWNLSISYLCCAGRRAAANFIPIVVRSSLLFHDSGRLQSVEPSFYDFSSFDKLFWRLDFFPVFLKNFGVWHLSPKLLPCSIIFVFNTVSLSWSFCPFLKQLIFLVTSFWNFLLVHSFDCFFCVVSFSGATFSTQSILFFANFSRSIFNEGSSFLRVWSNRNKVSHL